jgi:hypothetical protein
MTPEEIAQRRAEDATEVAEPGVTRSDCYSVAILALCKFMADPDARLCHGQVRNTVDGTGEYIGHAWVETPGTATYEDGSKGPITVVVDYTQPDPNARGLPLDFFMDQTGARDVRRFTREEALALAIKFHSDGPWPP